VLSLSTAAIVVLVVASAVLFVWPGTDRPVRVDAILSLNGSNEPARAQRAIALAEQGYAAVLLFSQGNWRTTPCPEVPEVEVVCFEPRPGRTIGEVEWAARYARRRGWHRLMVVAGRTQVSRARLLMDRCFPGRTLVVGAPAQVLHLPFEVLYEWAATARALVVDQTC